MLPSLRWPPGKPGVPRCPKLRLPRLRPGRLSSPANAGDFNATALKSTQDVFFEQLLGVRPQFGVFVIAAGGHANEVQFRHHPEVLPPHSPGVNRPDIFPFYAGMALP